jgi:NtrC-family two-component system response regulator AlgB
MNILLVDDDPNLRKSLRLALEAMGHSVAEARDGEQAKDLLRHRVFDIAFLDLRLAREHGLDVLPGLLNQAPGLYVIVMTAYATIDTAVEAIRQGAFDYLPKPFTPEQIRTLFARVGRAQLETPPASAGISVGKPVSLDDLEAEHIRRVLAAASTMEEAAVILGIDPSTLYRKRKRYGL